MVGKRIDHRALVRDIRSGLRDSEIQEKHGLAKKDLSKSIRELIRKRLIDATEIEKRADYFFKRIRRIAITAVFSDDELMNRLVLKGGNALDLVYAMEFRSSIDLDFSMDGEFDSARIEEIRLKIERRLVEAFLPEGYRVFDVTFLERPPRITPEMADFWGGYLVEFKIIEKRRDAERYHDLQTRRRRSVDVARAARKKLRIEISKFEYCDGKREQEFDDFTIYVYTPEHIVVEKIRAICQQMPEYGHIVKSRGQAPRPRDFFDIYVTMEHFRVDLTTFENLELIRRSFGSKRVPLEFIPRIKEFRQFHRQAFHAVEDTVYPGTHLEDFDFYFDYVVNKCEGLEALWKE